MTYIVDHIYIYKYYALVFGNAHIINVTKCIQVVHGSFLGGVTSCKK